jgi:aconitate hydratase
MNTLRTFTTGTGTQGQFHSLPALAEQGFPNLSRLPVSIRIVLESVLRGVDGRKVTTDDVKNLANYNAKAPGEYEIPFTVARIVLQDFTGVPLLVDLAAMRDAAVKQGASPEKIEPLVPVDLVVDHSVQVDFSGSQLALDRNMAIEFIRNRERYEFLKWGQQAFDTFSVVPPGIGIVHQVNLEFLAKGVLEKDGVYYPDTLVGTDSHTTMINGLGVVGWGVGGIEAEAGMLGQPVTFLVPEVVGVYLHGNLAEGVTATDLTLRITEILRKHGVVGKFVEFYGPGATALSLPDRATIANMAPEYGATMGFFPVDAETIAYLEGTGRSKELCKTVENYYTAQGLFGIPGKGECDYTDVLELDLSTIVPAVAGPKRPQDRIDVPALRDRFNSLFTAPVSAGGFGLQDDQRATRVKVTMRERAGVSVDSLLSTDEKHPKFEGEERNKTEMIANRPAPDEVIDPDFFPDGPRDIELSHGSVLIAAITSCTNTSNPSVMLAAGLLAKKANALGLTVAPFVKTSLAPGSRVVTEYLNATGLTEELDHLGFQTVGYGCTTCIGNSGPLHPSIESAIKEGDLVCASVLSGNRNFEARVHGSIKANFLMSPPLVVAYALAGRVDLDLTTEPLGTDKAGKPVFLADIWPSQKEIKKALESALKPAVFNRLYGNLDAANPKWHEIPSSIGATYGWDKTSTYIQSPPFFESTANAAGNILNARPLGIFGDSVTTDHISPAGSIKPTSPAGHYLIENGVEKSSFNSYGARRGNDRVMTRGTFANVRIKNLMCPGVEGGYTLYFGAGYVEAPDALIESSVGSPTFIYNASMAYQAEGTNLIVIGGDDYGMGSSRDWAAKGTRLLGVKAVITKSFERIHRSNLIGMGVLPLNFVNSADYDKVKGLIDATFDITGIAGSLRPMQTATLIARSPDGTSVEVPLKVRLDTPAEVDYYNAGGILPYVLNQILA